MSMKDEHKPTNDKKSTCTMLPKNHQHQAEPFGNDCGTPVTSLANSNSHGINDDPELFRRLLEVGTIGFNPDGI